MKVYVSHDRGYDFLNKLYKPLQNSQLNIDHELFLPHIDGKKGELTKDIIKKSDAVIAEVSYASTGQGIELGWADSSNVPIICIHQKNSELSGALKYLTKTLIIYKDEKDMINKLTATLDKLNESPKSSSWQSGSARFTTVSEVELLTIIIH